MNKERLQDLIEVLRAPELPEGVTEFDMATWMSVGKCGTSACAAGCYANAYPDRVQVAVDATGCEIFEVRTGRKSFVGLAYHFDIETAAAYWLFDPWEYKVKCVGREQVIDRIEAVIANNGRMPVHD